MADTTLIDDRPLGQSIRRGFMRRCPCCGEGKLFDGYLKVVDRCETCGEDFRAQRADDGPPWLTMLIVGHIMAPAMHVAFVHYRPDPMTLFLIFAVGCVGLSLVLLPRLKGLMVAFQWARRMHGFSRS